jgi:glycosyltransferase involved in cell wall biosynthesis
MKKNNKIKVAYITSEDSKDKKQFSGASHGIYQCLKAASFDVVRVGPINNIFYKLFYKFLLIIEIIFKLFNIKYDRDRSVIISKFYSKEIKRKLNNKNFDFILIHQCSLVSFLETKIPIIIWTDLTFDLYQKNYFKNFKSYFSLSKINGNKLEALALKKAKKIIYTSNYAKLNAIYKYKVKPNKIMILPFGSNIDVNLKDKQIQIMLDKRINSKKKIIKFLSVGGDWHRKGMDISIDVIKKLRNKGFNCNIDIVGEKEPKNYHKPDFVKTHGFLDRNKFIEKKKLISLFKDSHFFILLSRAEALGMVFNDAASYCLPSIAKNIGGVRSLIKNNSGILMPKNTNTEEIAEKISKILLNDNTYKTMSFLAHKQYKANSHWDQIALQLNKFFY